MIGMQSVPSRLPISIGPPILRDALLAVLLLLGTFQAASCSHEAPDSTHPRAPANATAPADPHPASATRPENAATASEPADEDPFAKATGGTVAPPPSAKDAVHIHGTVLSENGHPLAGAKVTLMTDALSRLATNALAATEDSNAAPLATRGTRATELVSNADGSFGSDVIAPGALDIEVTLRGYAPYRKDLGQLAPGARIDDACVVMHTTDWVAGVVHKSDGTPVANAAVHIEGPHIGPQGRPTFVQDNSITGSDGRFRYDSLPPGPYTLIASLGDPIGGALWKSEAMLAASGSASTVLVLKR